MPAGNALNTVSIRERIDLLIAESWGIRTTNTQRSLELAQEAFELASKLNYENGIAHALRNQAICYQLLSNYNISLKYCFEALPHFEKIAENKGIAAIYSCIGSDFFMMSDYENALLYHLKALKIRQELESPFDEGASLLAVGNVYASINDYDNAIKFYTQSEQKVYNINDRSIWARVLNGMGGLHFKRKEYEKAIEFYIKSLTIKNEIGDERSTASTLHNMGDCYIEQRDLKNAQECLLESIKVAVRYGDRHIEASCLQNIGRLFLVKELIPEAIDQVKRSLFIFNDLGSTREQSTCYKLLSDAYVQLKEYKIALEYATKHFQLQAEAHELESAKKIENLTLLREIELMKNESEIERLKNVELKMAYQQIEDKNRNILDSIEYAKYIQQRLLPHADEIKNSFPDSFIFFKPKDIVSGDFYWHHRTADKILFAVVDCTGHGVPGAFMSLVGNNMISNIVKVSQIYEPVKILKALNNSIAETFANEAEIEKRSLKNGMDIALCAFDPVTLEMHYAGAHNSIYLVRGQVLTEIKADSIAMGQQVDQQFTQHVIQLEKNDIVYLFSDGYADQKGGERRKKFYYPPFKQMLLDLSILPMDEQRNALYYTIKEWMKNEMQIDDMTVIGIKI